MNKFGRSFAKKGGGGLILPAESPRNKAQVGWGYRGAHGGGRYLDWDVPDTSADAAISTGLGGLRARSRDQVQNNPSGASAHQQYAAQLVGSGMMPRPLLKDSGLQREMMELWRVSCNESDADGDSPLRGMQGIVAMGGFEAGETLARRRVRRIEDGLEVPLQVQLIEGDLLFAGAANLFKGDCFMVKVTLRKSIHPMVMEATEEAKAHKQSIVRAFNLNTRLFQNEHVVLKVMCHLRGVGVLKIRF